MTTSTRGLNPLYERAGLAGLDRPEDPDVSHWIVDETEKVVRGIVQRSLVRASWLVAAAALALTVGFGGMTAVGQTYAAWSDFDTYDNQAGAGVWTIDVDIDVVNAINPTAGGLTQVKIFGTDTFDPATIDLDTVCFGSATTAAARSCNVVSSNPSGPGVLTIMLHFTTNQTGILAGDTTAVLTGKTLDGMSIFGIDTIKTVPVGSPAPAPALRLAPAPQPSGGAELPAAPEMESGTSDDVGPTPAPTVEADPDDLTPTPAPQDEAPQPVDPPTDVVDTDTPPLMEAPTESAPIEDTDTPPVVEAPTAESPPKTPLQEQAPDREHSAPDEEAEPPVTGEPAVPGVEEAPAGPIEVPDLVDLSARKAARQLLLTAGVPIDQIEPGIDAVDSAASAVQLLTRLCQDLLCAAVSFEERESDAHEPGTVLEQSLPAETLWLEGNELIVVVAAAPPIVEEAVETPDPEEPARQQPVEDQPVEQPAEEATQPKTAAVEELVPDAAAADGGES